MAFIRCSLQDGRQLNLRLIKKQCFDHYANDFDQRLIWCPPNWWPLLWNLGSSTSPVEIMPYASKDMLAHCEETPADTAWEVANEFTDIATGQPWKNSQAMFDMLAEVGAREDEDVQKTPDKLMDAPAVTQAAEAT